MPVSVPGEGGRYRRAHPVTEDDTVTGAHLGNRYLCHQTAQKPDGARFWVCYVRFTANTRGRDMKLAGAVLASAAVAGALIVAPPAEAATYYGAIVYQSSNGKLQSGVFRNYSSSTKMIVAIQNEWPDAGYVRFSSGRCGAVVHYSNDIFSGWVTSTGDSMDEASNSALREASPQGRTRLVRAACQG